MFKGIKGIVALAVAAVVVVAIAYAATCRAVRSRRIAQLAASGDAGARTLRITLDPQGFQGNVREAYQSRRDAIPRCWRNCIATADATSTTGTRICSTASATTTAAAARSACGEARDAEPMAQRGHADRTNSRRAARALRARGAELGRADLRVHRTLHLPGIVRGPDAVRTWTADPGRRGAAGGRLPGASRESRAIRSRWRCRCSEWSRATTRCFSWGGASASGLVRYFSIGRPGRKHQIERIEGFHATPWASRDLLRAIPGRSARAGLFVGGIVRRAARACFCSTICSER